MKRRPVENIASRLNKFPGRSFTDHCKEWSLSMSALLEVRSQLAGSAIEIDQYLLDTYPKVAADALKKFLTLTDEQALRLGQAFEFDHPERTNISRLEALNLSETGWSDDEIQVFQDTCANLMLEYGYGQDTQYFAEGIENNGINWI